MPYMMVDQQKVFVPQDAKYIEVDDQLVRTPWSGLLGDLGHIGQTTTPFTLLVFGAVVGYMYWRLRKAGGTLLPKRALGCLPCRTR